MDLQRHAFDAPASILKAPAKEEDEEEEEEGNCQLADHQQDQKQGRLHNSKPECAAPAHLRRSAKSLVVVDCKAQKAAKALVIDSSRVLTV